MSNLEEWSENKNLFISIFAFIIFANSNNFIDILSQTKERKFLSHEFPEPEYKYWFSLYRSPKKIIQLLKSIFELNSSGEGNPQTLADYSLLFMNLPLMLKDDSFQEQLKNITQDDVTLYFEKLKSVVLKDIKEDIDESYELFCTKEEVTAFLNNNQAELNFLIHVLFPSLIIYQEFPCDLYRNARLGDIDALEKLLTLDPIQLHNLKIGKQIRLLYSNHKTNDFERMLTAPLKPLINTEVGREYKLLIGSLLSFLASGLKIKLTAPDIQELLDAFTRDADIEETGILNDPDFEDDSKEGFYKAIYRRREEWSKSKLFYTDK